MGHPGEYFRELGSSPGKGCIRIWNRDLEREARKWQMLKGRKEDPLITKAI